jgi:hypothetical protein
MQSYRFNARREHLPDIVADFWKGVYHHRLHEQRPRLGTKGFNLLADPAQQLCYWQSAAMRQYDCLFWIGLPQGFGVLVFKGVLLCFVLFSCSRSWPIHRRRTTPFSTSFGHA